MKYMFRVSSSPVFMATCGCRALCQKVTVTSSYRFDKWRKSSNSGGDQWDDIDASSPALSLGQSSPGSASAYYSAVSVGIFPRPETIVDPRDVTFTLSITPPSRTVSEVSYVTAKQTADGPQWIPSPDPLPLVSHNMGASLPLRQEDTPHGTATWSPREACHFSVRCGPDYARTGTKAPSLPALYEPIGADLLRGDDVLSDVARHMNFPPLPPW